MPHPTTPSMPAPCNYLLEALRPADRSLIEARCVERRFYAGDVIHQPGDNLEYCYFPCGSALCSLLVELDCGTEVETVLVGREGALGGVVSHGALPAYARARVVHEGDFLCMAMADLDDAKRQSPAVACLFARYADCMMAQVFQSIACSATHTIEQRAAKWLCIAVDRVGCSEVPMTQEQLASVMGVGRSYASRVLQRFKHDGLLRTRRGGFEVLDAAKLSHRACGCKDRVDAHFESVLGGVYPAGSSRSTMM
ncbi:Crp/Fnr family transcriptional regulator [Novosphingobium mangrovi (ex Huang et al. 2023)]|uniref:Crp/Fnr family transcriptional regulator n=1 Tax=Novosphingobium mangrovi (ex Huang et al. 2023) TaxID=2976432 RepID=A0ABT2I5U5_9SPHN|nr:Crp/Fnr family transcriptional regulator [Novosphingobium mangrovi (ex Huang et al. 2023)]MCT2400180.1 Crp/Fnr family transcriptional regulator [Novosphingobium mangrovi (ex Huang et al. 2023)]